VVGLWNSNPEVLMAWGFQEISISGTREACAEVLTITVVSILFGAWGAVCRTRSLAVSW